MRLLDEQTKLLPISSEYYEALLADLEKYMQLVEQDVITIICDRLRKIGEMNPTSKKQISDLVRYYGADMDRIKKAIAKRLKMSAEEVDLIFEQAATDSADFATALAMGRQDLIDTRRMEQLAMAAAKRYKDYLLNLPDTFAFKFGDQLLPIRKAYIALTNQATLAVQSGALDYNTAIRNTVKRLADNGLQVINWESGYHRRADSSVRMNVMEGVRQLNQGMLDEAGKKFATGYELSAHDRPAPDHADIQGKQYTIEQFEALNSGLKRPIGTLNCMHIAYPIIYGVTKPTYSEEELEEMKANSKKEYEWQGKKLDGYECTQKQRWYETEIRKGIDRENALKAAGDDTGYRIEALKTSKLRSEYKAFSQYAGLSEKLNRTGVANKQILGTSNRAKEQSQIEIKGYIDNPKPGEGSLCVENGIELKENEENIQKWLFETFGGDIIALDDTKRDLCPDYIWNGFLWDLKSLETASIQTIDKRMRHGMKRINETLHAGIPGGLIIDFSNSPLDIETGMNVAKDIAFRKSKKSMKLIVKNGAEYKAADIEK